MANERGEWGGRAEGDLDNDRSGTGLLRDRPTRTDSRGAWGSSGPIPSDVIFERSDERENGREAGKGGGREG